MYMYEPTKMLCLTVVRKHIFFESLFLDYKHCSDNNGGCVEICRMVTEDSKNVSKCSCSQAGYQIDMDGRTCIGM